MFRHQRWTQKPPLGVQINWSNPLAKGIVCRLLFNEGGGDKVYDLSGNANAGTVKGVAFPSTATSGWNPSEDGPAVALDGVNDYIVIPDSPSLSMIGDMTIVVHVTFKNTDSTRTLIRKGTDGLDNIIWLWYWIGTVGQTKLSFYTATGDTYCTFDPVLNRAYDLAVVIRGTANLAEHYVDGVLQTNVQNCAPTWADDANPWIVAEWNVYDFNGIVSELFAYNRALTPKEILELHENPYEMFDWPSIWPVEAPPPPARQPRSPAMSGVPSAHF